MLKQAIDNILKSQRTTYLTELLVHMAYLCSLIASRKIDNGIDQDNNDEWSFQYYEKIPRLDTPFYDLHNPKFHIHQGT